MSALLLPLLRGASFAVSTAELVIVNESGGDVCGEAFAIMLAFL
ncbi:MAG: hypothetical protein RR133_04670 [Kiritimatiellia bacterium]